MILTAFAGIAEFDRDLTVEKTASGRTEAQKEVLSSDGQANYIQASWRPLEAFWLRVNRFKDVADGFKTHPSTIYRNLACKLSLWTP